MLRVKGTFKAFVDYISPEKSKRVKNAVLYVENTNFPLPPPPLVVLAVVDETLMWVFNEDVRTPQFLAVIPKAVRVEKIVEVPIPVR